MTDFYLDHNAKQSIATELTARGHTVITARSRQRDRASDPAILLDAVHEERVVITYNSGDFEMLHDAWLRWRVSPEHFGILVIPEEWSATHAAEEITQLISSRLSIRNELWKGKVNTAWAQIDPLSP
jgi:hypothetical protein